MLLKGCPQGKVWSYWYINKSTCIYRKSQIKKKKKRKTREKPGLRMTLRIIHPRKMTAIPTRMQPEIARSTLLFRTTDFNQKHTIEMRQYFSEVKTFQLSKLGCTHEGSLWLTYCWNLSRRVSRCECLDRCTDSARGHSLAWLYASPRAALRLVGHFWTCASFSTECLHFLKRNENPSKQSIYKCCFRDILVFYYLAYYHV